MRHPDQFDGRRPSTGLKLMVFASALLTSGCDPVVNFYGSFFPAWVICVAMGILLSAVCRWIFVVTRLERQLGPLVLIYPALAFLMMCLTWLVLFGP
jgi:hypothetical protein